MTTRKNTRTNLNPALALTFLIVSVTGILMLFHVHGGRISHLHEWMSVVFVVLCIVHLSLNWKSLLVYLKQGPVAISIVAVALLSALLLFSGGDKERQGFHGRSDSGRSGHLYFNH